MSEPHSVNAAAAREQLRVERVFAEQAWAQGPAYADACARARDGSLQLLAGWEGEEEAARAAALRFASALLSAGAQELVTRPRELAALLARLQEAAGLSRMDLAAEVLRSPELAARPPAQAVELQLGLLAGIAPLHSVSLWTLDATARLSCVQHVGAGASSRSARALAGGLLGGERVDPGADAELLGLPVQRAQRTVAALVARCERSDRELCRAVMSAALDPLAALLERDTLMSRNAASERALLETSERRLTRLGFDLHDGPLQELLLLAQDLRMFRDQLGGVLREGREARLLRGRLDDLDARLVALERSLRAISTSVHANVLIDRPLVAAIEDLIQAFASRTGVRPSLALEGDETTLSRSQRIALLNVLGEALNNVREHGEAEHVTVSVTANAAGVQAQVLDDGRGFDVEAALIEAGRRGRIGLAGIHERVRLLGGQCVVESRPGGPTAVSLVLPHWEPLSGGGQDQASLA